MEDIPVCVCLCLHVLISIYPSAQQLDYINSSTLFQFLLFFCGATRVPLHPHFKNPIHLQCDREILFHTFGCKPQSQEAKLLSLLLNKMTSLLFCCSLSGCPLVALIFVNRQASCFSLKQREKGK